MGPGVSLEIPGVSLGVVRGDPWDVPGCPWGVPGGSWGAMRGPWVSLVNPGVSLGDLRGSQGGPRGEKLGTPRMKHVSWIAVDPFKTSSTGHQSGIRRASGGKDKVRGEGLRERQTSPWII